MTRCTFVVACLILAASPHPASAQDDAAPGPAITIGYVELADDARYRRNGEYAGIAYRTLGRPYDGARLGIEDAQTIGRVVGREFRLTKASGGTVAELQRALAGWVHNDDVHFVIADLPPDALLQLADATSGLPMLLMNVSAADDRLRGEDCRRNIVHFIPAESMLSDALVQYLVARNWTRILVLQGPAAEDARRVDALKASSAKFGAQIVEVRPFTLGQDPRKRNENNVALATAGIDTDTVFVADTTGEFARYVPYSTAKPIPVVGDAGLMAKAWHWSWYRHGAPQLQHRFEGLALPRRMNSEAWAAWAAAKAVTQAAFRAPAYDFDAMRDFMLSGRMKLDGSKGSSMSIRAWDHQLRQPILLTTADAVIERAPLPGYLHQTDTLDTLGVDQPETRCHM